MPNTEKNMRSKQTLVMVIFGGSGDLTKRKLMPSLYLLFKRGRMPDKFAILGAARTAYTDESYRKYIDEQLQKYIKPDEYVPDNVSRFLQCIYYITMDPSIADYYPELKKRLEALDLQLHNPGNYLYYLATPPVLYETIPLLLQSAELNRPTASKEGFKRIIVEKPFGHDLASARRLDRIYISVFRENQIFRIDHFLGKETVQNILALRFANVVLEPLWNRNYIHHVEITAVENMGIEQRGGFYDHTGALRDMVQSHLLQVLAVCAMEPPVSFDADSFRNEVVKVYQSLKPMTPQEIRNQVIRGQYTASEAGKRHLAGYRQEAKVAPDSRIETYVAMKLNIANWRWDGVPFYIRTGKRMPTLVSEIVIHFKPTPHIMFSRPAHCPPPNRMIIRLNPNEGVVFTLSMKVPGSGFDMGQVPVEFTYESLGGVPSGDAYARLLEDCMQGETTLFTRSDAVEASWRFLEPILHEWTDNPRIPLYGYPAGSWGPEAAGRIMGHEGSWTNPCKNLTKTNLYCEL